MASVGQSWEVVSKSSKKTKGHGQNLSKTQKKAFVENMPRIENAPPVKESPTIYDAFIDKNEKPESNGFGNHEGNKADSTTTSRKIGHNKKGKAQEKKEKPPSLDDAIKKIQCNELETLLAKDQATFPDNPSIWIKDLASMLNLQLDKVVDTDPIFNGKPKNYPCNILPPSVKKVLVSSINECSDKILELFFEHCVQQMMNDMGKGIPTIGYRIFIQLVAMEKSNVVLANLKKYQDLMKTQQNRPLRCLSIMWAIGQAGNRYLDSGIKVWLEAMLPMMNVRALSAYVVDYLETLFKYNKDITPAYSLIGFRNFFPILDMIFATNSSLPTNLQKKLLSLYPKLKAISFGKQPENNLRNFFPSFLARLSANCQKSLKAELLDCLVECIAVDRHCFSVWRQMYTKQLRSSSVLLEYMSENWDSVGKRLEKKLLQETIQAFSITNDELAIQGTMDKDGYKKCVVSCKELLVKISTMKFPWRIFLFMIIASLVGLLAYDIHLAGTFKKSKTAGVLEDAGLLVFLEQAWSRLCHYSEKTLLWMKINVPHYYSKTIEFVGPYLVVFWNNLYELGVYLFDASKPCRDWLSQNLPLFLEWMQNKIPGLIETCSHYLQLIWAVTLEYSLWLWQLVVRCSHLASDWLQQNIFTGNMSGENIQKSLSTGMTAIQSYSSSAFQWVVQQFSSTSK